MSGSHRQVRYPGCVCKEGHAKPMGPDDRFEDFWTKTFQSEECGDLQEYCFWNELLKSGRSKCTVGTQTEAWTLYGWAW